SGGEVKRGEGGYMGKPAVVISVEKQPHVDTVRLTGDIEEALRQISTSLPAGIEANQILFRQSNFIETSIHNVQRVLIEAAIVVAAGLFALLLKCGTTAISLTPLPGSVPSAPPGFSLSRLL